MSGLPPLASARSPLVLAIDMGTSSVRALLFDDRGQQVDGVDARETYAMTTRAGGAVETDADALLDRVWRCVDGALTQAGPRAHDIAAVAASTFVSNILGVDRAGRPVTPLMTYADTRPSTAIPRLHERFDESDVHQRTGCRFHPSYFPARFLWIADAHPDWLQQAARWITIGEYMARQLFGHSGVSYSVASWSGLLNRHTLDWDEQLLAALPIEREQLAPLVDVYDGQRGLSQPFAARWPALGNALWLPAMGDGATANVGSGCTAPDRVALTVGTTSAMRIVTDQPVARVPDGLWCYRVDRDHALVGGAMTEGGNLFAWVRDHFRLEQALKEDQSLEDAIAALAPDSHGLTFLPLLGGERSPGWNADLRGALLGISLSTNALDILRAGLEGVACRIALVHDRLRPLLPDDATILASGGAILSSPAWLQIMADALAAPVIASTVTEASARGAALLALVALGELPDIHAAPPPPGRQYAPDAHASKVYRAVKARQRRLYRYLVEEGGDDAALSMGRAPHATTAEALAQAKARQGLQRFDKPDDLFDDLGR
jgi:gluconokinase